MWWKYFNFENQFLKFLPILKVFKTSPINHLLTFRSAVRKYSLQTIKSQTTAQIVGNTFRISGNFFYWKLTIGTTTAAIEANNDTYYLQKRIEKIPLCFITMILLLFLFVCRSDRIWTAFSKSWAQEWNRFTSNLVEQENLWGLQRR